MLSFDLRSLESHAVVVNDDLSADDPIWERADVKPEGSVHVSGRLSAAGAGRFYWHGRIEGDVVLECNRCLSEARAHVKDEAHVIFAEVGSEETDDPDVYPLDPKAQEIDLRPVIREEWLLVAPTYALCREINLLILKGTLCVAERESALVESSIVPTRPASQHQGQLAGKAAS